MRDGLTAKGAEHLPDCHGLRRVWRVTGNDLPAARRYAPGRWLGRILAVTLALLGTAGCRTARPLPPANLAEPGWTVRHGQAVWHLPKMQREIAGEVIVATRTDGECFVQFTKSPFPIVTARATPRRWFVEFPPQNKHYAGRGAPPKRVIWLWLPRVLTGKPPPRNWSWHQDASGWKLQDHNNGEELEGFFES